MTYTIIQPNAHVVKELFRIGAPTDNNEFEWIPAGHENVWYEVAVDHEAVARMACKAASNFSQISRVGPLRVRVLKREPLE